FDPIKYKTGSIFSIRIDKKGRIWCASEGQGLMRFFEKEKTFKKYTMKDGLPSNIVYGILEDKRGHLWLSTTNGLSRFNPETEKFTNYTVGDGLKIKEFNYGAAAETAAGELIFGGINGFVMFKPEEINSVNVKTHLMFTDFKIFNVSSKVGANNSPLMRVIDQTDTISLRHDQNSLTFDFTSINYTNLSETLYSWTLDGLDKTWSPPGRGHSAVYTNLKPGNYTFRVKSINPSSALNQERTIVIQISPPFWETYWAYFFYLSVLFALSYFIVRYYHIQISENHAKDKINFFTNIAHDIRTPLSLIRSPLSLALKRNDASAETLKSLRTADQNAERLSLLINQLLDFEKADMKKNELNLTLVNIEQTISDLCVNFTPYLHERGITLKKNFKRNNTIVALDRDKFEKIIFNLLSNAFKYTLKGGLVEIITDISGNNCLIEISDTGIGIPREQQKYIFKRYFRAQNVLNSNETGSGIGLMLTRKLIEQHKGTVNFESTVDKGSTFRVLLPLTEIPTIETATPASVEHDRPAVADTLRPAATVNGKKPVLLIAEDHAELRTHLTENLSHFFVVHQAENGKEALKLTRKVFPDVIISDVMMLEMNGSEFCAEIKNNIDTSHIPFILLTSLTATQNKVDGIKTGADIYLEKPFNLEVLKSYVDNLLLNQKRLKEKFLKSEMTANDGLSDLDKDFVSNGIRIIEENLSNSQFSVEDFEKAMGMSHAALYRKFKTLIGKTPLDFINQYRLKKAAELLKQGGYNVNEVAYMVGFSDPKYFSTSFKKLFGSNASDFREKTIPTVIKNS
ncbi:MAG TPA: ATP-binding protein, partial [Sphingobacteriaceae bacterium]